MRRDSVGPWPWVPALLVVAWLIPTPLVAHRAHISLTTVEWNARARTLELIHRVHLHDAQRVLDEVAPTRDLALADLEGRARFALYVESCLALWLGSEEAELALTLVGAEIEGDHILVFQEIELPEHPSALRVKCTLLRDLFDDQANHVNLTVDERTRTLRFSGEDETKSVRF
jgi:hypothetical protein